MSAFETFRYIEKPRDKEYNPDDVLENKYKTVEALSKKYVIFNHAKYQYLVFDSFEGMKRYIENTPNNDRYFHEVIFGMMKQKIKIDVDGARQKIMALPFYKNEEVITPSSIIFSNDIMELLADIELPTKMKDADKDEFEERCKYVLETIVKALKDTFFIIYQHNLHDEQIVICRSLIPKNADNIELDKCSYHIIVDGYHLTNHEQGNEFTKRMAKYLPAPIRELLDMGVNKTTQNFRLMGSMKQPGKNGVKGLIENPYKHSFAQTVITNTTGTEELPEIRLAKRVGIPINDIQMHPDDLQRVLQCCDDNGIMKDNRFRKQRGDTLIFTRDRPSWCDFCGRVHDNDNTVKVTVKREDNIIIVYKSCWRDSKRQFVNIGNVESNIAPVNGPLDGERKLPNKIKDSITDWAEKNILNALKVVQGGGSLFPTKTLFDNLDTAQKNVYSGPTIKPFELSHTLCVQAHMKMGKTKNLLEYIDKYFGSKINPAVIRIVSFRQTFSGNLKEKFPNFTLYSDVQGPLTQCKLIIQVESLHRLAILENTNVPDLLILDECESIFEQFSSGLAKSFNGAFCAFEWLLKYSRHVICMDANLGDRTYRILERMRPEFNKVPGVILHKNTYENACDDNYYFTADKFRWYGILYAAMANDEKIAIPMSSKTEAKALERNLRKLYPAKCIKLYSSETSQTERKDHFADVNLHWSQYDVLIYTPTVSAGVSFEIPHFTKIFGYFTDQSCPVETCVQMIGRIRSVGTHKFYICLSATGNTLPTDVDRITEFAQMKRENLIKTLSESLLSFEYQENGKILIYRGNYFHMWAENTRIANISRNSFIRLFIHTVGLCGAQANHLSEAIYTECTGFQLTVDGELNADLAEIKTAHETVKNEIKQEEYQYIIDATELTDEEAEEIVLHKRADKEITSKQRYAYERYRLRQDYNYPTDGVNNIIDKDFMNTYFPYEVRRTYRNLCRIAACETIDESIRQIQREEYAIDKHMSELDETSQQFLVNRKNVFEKHRIALGLFKACGWQNLTDEMNLHVSVLADNIKKSEIEIINNFDIIRSEFQRIHLPSMKSIVHNRGNVIQYVKLFVDGIINKIMELIYGIRIGPRRGENDMYMIYPNTKFALAYDTNRPFIRKI